MSFTDSHDLVCAYCTPGIADDAVNSAADLDDTLIGVKGVNASPDFVVACYTSHSQANDFYEVMLKHCNLGVDRRFVHFLDKDPSVSTQRSFNSVEILLVGYYNGAGNHFLPYMTQWQKGVEFLPKERPEDVRSNLMAFPSLKSFFRSGSPKGVRAITIIIFHIILPLVQSHRFLQIRFAFLLGFNMKVAIFACNRCCAIGRSLSLLHRG